MTFRGGKVSPTATHAATQGPPIPCGPAPALTVEAELVCNALGAGVHGLAGLGLRPRQRVSALRNRRHTQLVLGRLQGLGLPVFALVVAHDRHVDPEARAAVPDAWGSVVNDQGDGHKAVRAEAGRKKRLGRERRCSRWK